VFPINQLGLGPRIAFDAHPDGSRSHQISPAAPELAKDLTNPLYNQNESVQWGGGNFETNSK